jgi:S-adenosylmethionine synthetase
MAILQGRGSANELLSTVNLRFPSIVKGGFYQKLAAYGHFGRPDLEILPWESIDRVPVLQAAKI